ncbi:MAG: sulfite exporter TauE/SafE family protein [Ruminococcaceae bacterium]|nr:sulfite exporter TauE/SafE family protein [Oscillospiraceae bacterium]
MEPHHIVLLILVGAGGGFVQRVSGFGLGIFVMMFLPHFLPNHTAAAAVSALFACATATYNAIRYHKNIAYKTALPMMCAALVSIPVAVYFSARVPGDIFKILLGSVLIILSIYFLFFNKKIKIKPTVTNGIISGTLGGALGGLFSTGGPPAVLYLTHAAEDNLTYFATIQFYFCFTNLYGTANRAINGIINGEVLIFAAVGIIGCMLGDFLGKLIFDKLDGKKLKTIIYTGMIISGVIMFF